MEERREGGGREGWVGGWVEMWERTRRKAVGYVCVCVCVCVGWVDGWFELGGWNGWVGRETDLLAPSSLLLPTARSPPSLPLLGGGKAHALR